MRTSELTPRRGRARSGIAALFSLVVMALFAACDPPQESRPGFEWSIDVVQPEDALLSAWIGPKTGAIRGLAVGGRVSAGLVLEWDAEGAVIAPALPSDTPLLWWVAAQPNGTAVAVGEGATVLRRDGTWKRDRVDGIDPRYTLFGTWGAWAVGGSFEPGMPPGIIARWTGSSWRVVAETDQALFKVWGVDPSDVWAVGEHGKIMHYDGAAWTAVATSSTDRLVAVSGRATDEVYAVGGTGTGVVLRWNGLEWSRFAETPEELSGVWTAPRRALYVGGNRGYLARFGSTDDADPDPVQMTATIAVDTVDFHALAGADVVVAVGADLLSAGTGQWRGTLASHGASTLGGSVVVEPPIDAGPRDAGSQDASDGAPADARWPTEGESCGVAPAACADGLTCWYLWYYDTRVCTQSCSSVGDCAAYGAGACCGRPGPQTLNTVCIPAPYACN